MVNGIDTCTASKNSLSEKAAFEIKNMEYKSRIKRIDQVSH